MTRRRWIADDWDGHSASVKGEEAAHLIRVLRAQAGMEYDLLAGDRVWRAVISGVGRDAVQFTLLFELEAEPALPVTLLLSIFKFDRMEWIIEKATELGVERFIPTAARRSERHLAQAAPARLERWRRVAREAAKQSRRSDVPVVEDLIPLKSAASIRPQHPGLSLLLAEQERSTTLYATMQAVVNQSNGGETGGEPRCWTGRRVDRGGRSAIRSRRLAARQFTCRESCAPRRQVSRRWRWLPRCWVEVRLVVPSSMIERTAGRRPRLRLVPRLRRSDHLD